MAGNTHDPVRRRFLKIIGGLVAVGAVGLAVSQASAHGPRHRPKPWQPRPIPRVSAQIESANGGSLQTFQHRGQTFVLGDHGDRYVIVVRNPTAQRVEAVVSVDGRDVINGRRGDFVRNRGYVVPAFGTTRIDGFRQSLDHVAAFRFGDPGESYSAQMGTPENVGVIGVAVFTERVSRAIARERSDSAAAPRAKSAPGRSQSRRVAPSAGEDSAGRLGTQWGEDRTSRVSQTRFERQSNSPTQIISLRYDDAAGLQARGIDVFPRRWRPIRPVSAPQPFPNSGFAPPPPGR
ncbi:MAG TPA: hypothetical protein PKD61_06935 [Polyangiaceae bacterium]|nr:hypothetical protein [Polyangiaceae bacterium]